MSLFTAGQRIQSDTAEYTADTSIGSTDRVTSSYDRK